MSTGNFADHNNFNIRPYYNACLLFRQLYHFNATVEQEIFMLKIFCL